MTTNVNEEWITTTEAAALSGYHPNHIRRLVHSGAVQARKWGPAFMIDRRSLLAYIEQTQAQGDKRGPKPKAE